MHKALLKKGKGRDPVWGKTGFGVALCSCLSVVGFVFFSLQKPLGKFVLEREDKFNLKSSFSLPCEESSSKFKFQLVCTSSWF